MEFSVKRAGLGMLEALAVLRQMPKVPHAHMSVPELDMYADAIADVRFNTPSPVMLREPVGYRLRGTCCETPRVSVSTKVCLDIEAAWASRDAWFQVVAHQDDDLLFMNPSLLRAIECGTGDVVTVYLTAGDAGRAEDYWRGREAGIRAAYAQMAGVTDTWCIDEVHINGVSFDRHRLEDVSRVQLLFCQLPDGGTSRNPCGNERENLRRLWRGEIDAVQPVCEKDAITADNLIGALALLMQRHRPTRLNLLDCTGQYEDDHDDHHDSALFGLAAAERCGLDMQVALHRGYNIKNLPQNLNASVVDEVQDIFKTYIQYDAALCPPSDEACEIRPWYGAWLARDIAPMVGEFVAGAQNCTRVDKQDQ